MLDVFEALCTAVAQKVRDFNARNVANTLWAMAKTGAQMLDVFAAHCTAAAQKDCHMDGTDVVSDLFLLRGSLSSGLH